MKWPSQKMLKIKKQETNEPSWRLVSLVMAFLFLLLTLTTTVLAQDNAQASENQVPEVTADLSSNGLVVPVYPRFKPPKGETDISSLKDSYIVMEDGSVLSVADWLLGSLTKSETGVGMSDYQNRLFLGQVARAAAGMDERLVYTSFRDAGPLRLYRPERLPGPLEAAQGFLSLLVPGLAPNWSPAVTGKPNLVSVQQFDRGVGGAILFGEQFSEALFQTSEDFIYQGQLFNMMKEHQETAPE